MFYCAAHRIFLGFLVLVFEDFVNIFIQTQLCVKQPSGVFKHDQVFIFQKIGWHCDLNVMVINEKRKIQAGKLDNNL